MLKHLPSRAVFRKDSEDPKPTKSITDREDPSDAVPYMLLDAIAMPPKPREALHERLVLQPPCYQVNDHARRLSLLRASFDSK